MKQNKYRCCLYQAGLWNPQIRIQFTPLCWGLGVGAGGGKFAFQFGPVAIAVWFLIRNWVSKSGTTDNQSDWRGAKCRR